LQQQTFSSPRWNPYWKEDNLSLPRRFKKTHWEWCIKSG
jgi:hypothetical protein